MSDSQKIPWNRIAVEAVAIVASILLAFAIDAGWQEYVEDQNEREVLIALLDDFETSKANIRDWREFHLAVQQSTTELLRAVTTEKTSFTTEETDRLLGDIGWWDSQAHFSTGALNSLVYGGELSIIEDDALRRMLADWPSQIEHVTTTQNQDYDFFLNVLMPFYRANSYLPMMATSGTEMPGRPEIISAVIDLQLDGTWSNSDMLENEEFHNILVQKWWIQFDILFAFDETEALLDETIEQIKSRL